MGWVSHVMKIIYEKRKKNKNLKKTSFGSQNKRPKYSFLFSKCILSNYWDEKKLESFLEFLTVEKLTKYIPKMYEELDAQQFANLLFGLKTDLASKNYNGVLKCGKLIVNFYTIRKLLKHYQRNIKNYKNYF